MNKAAVNENLELLQSTLEQWLSFQKYIKRSMADQPANPSEETAFLEIKSNISRTSRSIAEKMKAVGKMEFGEKLMRELLTKCVSIDHMYKLPPSDKRGLMKEAHVVTVRMTRTVGALKMLSEGYVPQEISKKKKRKKGEMGKKVWGFISGVAAVIIIIGYYALRFLDIL